MTENRSSFQKQYVAPIISGVIASVLSAWLVLTLGLGGGANDSPAKPTQQPTGVESPEPIPGIQFDPLYSYFQYELERRKRIKRVAGCIFVAYVGGTVLLLYFGFRKTGKSP